MTTLPISGEEPRTGKRVLVTGGRNYADQRVVWRALDQLQENGGVAEVIHGCALGADALADAWATYYGIPAVRCPADWAQHGHAAGPIRNRLMILQHPDVVLAFPGGKGTADMVRQAKRAGIPTIHSS